MTKRRELIITDDGSSTLYIPELNEHYHSHFGALQESKHIFIKSGLAQILKEEISVLEFGFGTGLNALQSYIYANTNNKKIRYLGIEKHPITLTEINQLNYTTDSNIDFYNKIHSIEWDRSVKINSKFILYKKQIDFRDFKSGKDKFDIVYYDAFGPDIQPYLWTEDIFNTIYNSINTGGLLMTYTVKGTVRRALKSAGFKVEKIAGPPGKREITRAYK